MIRALALLTIGLCAMGADAPAMTPVATGPDDLQNLVACARMHLPNLTADQIAAVAIAIKHAEADIAAMRKAQAEMPAPPPVQPATTPATK